MSLKATPATVWLSLGSLGLTVMQETLISSALNMDYHGLLCPWQILKPDRVYRIDRCTTVMVILHDPSSEPRTVVRWVWNNRYGEYGVNCSGLKHFRTACIDLVDNS